MAARGTFCVVLSALLSQLTGRGARSQSISARSDGVGGVGEGTEDLDSGLLDFLFLFGDMTSLSLLLLSLFLLFLTFSLKFSVALKLDFPLSPLSPLSPLLSFLFARTRPRLPVQPVPLVQPGQRREGAGNPALL